MKLVVTIECETMSEARSGLGHAYQIVESLRATGGLHSETKITRPLKAFGSDVGTFDLDCSAGEKKVV